MGESLEVKVLLPETPGRPGRLNPFESPNDYHSLHESMFASPSVFKSSQATIASPANFRWSIDHIARLNPVEIDPEDVQRQSQLLSDYGTDKDIEERRQKAIDQFFSKNMIVPSPWTQEVKPATQLNSTNCPSSLEHKGNISSMKVNAACQTVLSLPLNFNLEKILGDYYRADESDQSHESFGSTSLRRKLFIDGSGSDSEISTSPIPERDPCVEDVNSVGLEGPLDLSPVHCKVSVETPSSGQFSSSPIQGGRRAYSLGSMASPSFPESYCAASPAFSPVTLSHGKTPAPGECHFNFRSPVCMTSDSLCFKANHCTQSPYVEGCSPIRSCYIVGTNHHRSKVHGTPSPDCLTFINVTVGEEKENLLPNSSTSPTDMETVLQYSDIKAIKSEPLTSGAKTDTIAVEFIHLRRPLEKIEELKENNTIDMTDNTEPAEEDNTWTKEAAGANIIPMTSSRTGSLCNVETSHIYLSLLAESSVIPSDCNSIQVDSGYNTHSTASISDCIISEYSGKECVDVHTTDDACFPHKLLPLRSKLQHLYN
ncbi:protein aurora borealis [Polypterus senegalus]|uniref:protein aurora borealis n=1 Tax=Polypterus senegalus TaxID=55291 RepID=UPI001962ABF1|nr:protein aurora borealis [Polypterus senegalus]XP_039601266.1 protein aurora borealis [Polypterus senegalus]